MAYDLNEEENGDGNKLDKSNELAKSQSKDKRAKKDRKSPTKSKAQLSSQATPSIENLTCFPIILINLFIFIYECLLMIVSPIPINEGSCLLYETPAKGDWTPGDRSDIKALAKNKCLFFS